ncbi:MAG: L-threonylcarbamoyladenylate synthase [Promethearchaeota archaeon]
MGFLIKIKGKELKDIDLYLETAVDFIIQGKLLAFPTDSVYGIGGDPLNTEVIERIFEIKYRDRKKGLLLLVADYGEATKIAQFNSIANILVKHYWPGQLTLILNRSESCIIPEEISGFQDTIGIRVPENEIIFSILEKLKARGRFGGIIGTSANYGGESPSISGDEVARKFLSPIDFIIDGGKSKSKISTTIVDCTSQEPKFLRIGAISDEEVLDVLKKSKND